MVENELLQFVTSFARVSIKIISQTKIWTILDSFNFRVSGDFKNPEIQYRVHNNNIDSTFRPHALTLFLYES